METKRRRLGMFLLSGGRQRHGLFLLSGVCAILVGIVTYFVLPDLAVVLGAITLFAVYLALVALVMPILTGPFLKARAAEADMPVIVIFAVVLATVGVCGATLFMALHRGGQDAGIEVALSIVSVLLGWFTIHTMAALHYAYEYYEPVAKPSGTGTKPAGGLVFPEDREPDGVEFLYFAYVIGVAFAVSDIQARSRKMRRLVLIHSTFAYFFNTLILAATVNVAVAVGS